MRWVLPYNIQLHVHIFGGEGEFSKDSCFICNWCFSKNKLIHSISKNGLIMKVIKIVSKINYIRMQKTFLIYSIKNIQLRANDMLIK